MKLPVVIYQDEDDFYIGEIPVLRGVHSYGKTLEELNSNLQEAITLYLESEGLPEKFPQKFLFQTLELPVHAKA